MITEGAKLVHAIAVDIAKDHNLDVVLGRSHDGSRATVLFRYRPGTREEDFEYERLVKTGEISRDDTPKAEFDPNDHESAIDVAIAAFYEWDLTQDIFKDFGMLSVGHITKEKLDSFNASFRTKEFTASLRAVVVLVLVLSVIYVLLTLNPFRSITPAEKILCALRRLVGVAIGK